MKNKLLISFLAVIILTLCTMGLVACNTRNDGHSHNWSKWTPDNATTHTHYCSCGESETKNHNLVNDYCAECGYNNKTPEGHTHSWDKWTSDNEYTHSRKCLSCNVNQTETHKILNGECSVCEYKTESIVKSEFTVTFNCNGGTLVDGDLVQKIRKGESATAPNVQRNGYALSWDNKFDNVTENISITAVWTAIFNFNNGTISGLTSYGVSLPNIEVPSVIDGYAVRTIADSAFANDMNLKSIVIPQSVTTFGQGVYDSTPNSIVATYEIGGMIFDGCSNLESLTLPFVGYRPNSEVLCVLGYLFGHNEYQNSKKITQQTNAAQFGNGNLISYIPKSLKSVTITGGKIQAYAFQGCSNLTEVNIGDGVTLIGNSAFYGCSGLTSISIPENVTSISGSAFNNCSGLTSINVSSENTIYHSINNCLINTTNKTLVLGCKNSEIPYDGTVTSIGDYAFGDCIGITNMKIPNSVTSIGSYAFYRCSGLTSITIGNSVTAINTYAFFRCSRLSSIIIPESVTSIGESAFCECSGLTSIVIPKNVTLIGKNAFINCSLNCVEFKNAQHWFVAGMAISSSDLLDTAIACQYLTSTYYYYTWTRT